MNRTGAILILLASCLPVSAKDKTGEKDFIDRYKGKFVVVLREGLAGGICASGRGPTDIHGRPLPVPFRVRIAGETAEYKTNAGFGAGLIGCGEIAPEPIHKGEVLQVVGVSFRKGALGIGTKTVNAHQINRGVGAFEHDSYEQAVAGLEFVDCESTEGCQAAVEKWLKLFDTQEEAAKFGNTASGVFVKEVKLGMTFAEVEGALGPPATKASLGDKVLYKYKDMTVEFHDGKVTDVR